MKTRILTEEWLEPSADRTTAPLDYKFVLMKDCTIDKIEVTPRVRIAMLRVANIEHDAGFDVLPLRGEGGAYVVVSVAQKCEGVRIHVKYHREGRRVLKPQKKSAKKALKKGKKR